MLPDKRVDFATTIGPYSTKMIPSRDVVPKRWFLCSVAVVLAATAILKVVGALGHAEALDLTDPLLSFLTNRQIMLLAAGVEVCVVTLLLLDRDYERRLLSTAFISGVFVAYRLLRLRAGVHETCPCLGVLSGSWIGASPWSDTVLKVSLGYMLAGSYLLLLVSWARSIASARQPEQMRIEQLHRPQGDF